MSAGSWRRWARRRSSGLVTEAVLAGGLGLLAVIASVFLLIWFGRKVTGDLTRLHGSVRAMAEERLPRVVERLRPRRGRGRSRGVAAARRQHHPGDLPDRAVRSPPCRRRPSAAAVEQARLRKGINQVFLNISLRNQSLLHRQLGMLDGMERRTSDPGALADLFRLDHLTTRMRRHAEGLIILSGSTPGRGWRDPVPVVDVLRAAVAEVEDYVRVDVVSESPDLVAGIAVNDVIHLVAELVENATVFSPPNTRIEVRADRVGTGLVAEVEDRGLGLSADEIADINRRLASPSEFDLANSEKLGLFVVSSLAARHTDQGLAPPVRLRGHDGHPPAAVRRDRPGGRGRIARRRPFRRRAGSAAGPGQPGAGAPLTGDARPVAVRRDRPAPAARGRDRAAGGHRRDPAHRGPGMAPGSPDLPAVALGIPRTPAAAAARRCSRRRSRRPPWDVVATSPWPQAFQRDVGGQTAPQPVDPARAGTASPASGPCPQPATEAPSSTGGQSPRDAHPRPAGQPGTAVAARSR